MSIDTLHIADLCIGTHIGVHAWEQRIIQQLTLDITLPMDFSNCQDALANTLDYDDLCRRVTTFVESNAFALIETVAEQVAAFIKETFQIKQLIVSVSKPHAVSNAKTVRVTIER